jgi:hypothetical protein
VLTVKQIMDAAPKNRQKKAKYVAIRAMKIKTNAEGMPIVLAKTQTTQKPGGGLISDKKANLYLTTVEVYPKKQVIVSCSCDDFMYTWEVALSMKGAARIEFSNGEMPDERNPLKIAGCCGHIYALADHLIGKGML